MTEAVVRTLLTPVGRLSHPHLIVARAYKEKGKEKGKPRFETNLLIDADAMDKFRVLDPDTNELRTVRFADVVTEMFLEAFDELKSQEDIKEAARLGGLKWPIASGNKVAEKQKAHAEAFEGRFLISAHTGEDYPPNLMYKKDGSLATINPVVPSDVTMGKQLFRGGNYADLEVNAKTMKVDGKKFVTLYLNCARFIKTGESFGRGASLMELDGAEGGEAEVDATKGLDDEIPF